MLISNQWITAGIKEEIKNGKWDKWQWKYNYLWDTPKTILRRKFITIKSYLKKQEISQINNLKQLEKEEQTKPKVNRRKEIIKVRVEINEIETNKTIAKINETKSSFFEKIYKIDICLGRLIRGKKERIQINKIRSEKEVTMDTTETQRIIRHYYKQLYVNKMDNLEEMNKFLERYNVTRLNQEDIENINRLIEVLKLKLIKNLPTNKHPGSDGFSGKF